MIGYNEYELRDRLYRYVKECRESADALVNRQDYSPDHPSVRALKREADKWLVMIALLERG